MKTTVTLLLLIILLMACAPATPATQIPASSNPSTSEGNTPTPDFTAKLFGNTDLYAGPGDNYPKVGTVTGSVQITGQAHGCTWFQVLSSEANLTGWISADKITYTVQCAEVPGVSIPPTPGPTDTFTPISSPTFTPSATFTLIPTAKSGATAPPKNTCNAASAMTIGNRTGAYASFELIGPGTFYVNLPPDQNTTVAVCEGCYDVYIINGACGDTSGSMVFKLCDGFNGWIYCNK